VQQDRKGLWDKQVQQDLQVLLVAVLLVLLVLLAQQVLAEVRLVLLDLWAAQAQPGPLELLALQVLLELLVQLAFKDRLVRWDRLD
jgi:uncharacterized integral membrane protein